MYWRSRNLKNDVLSFFKIYRHSKVFGFQILFFIAIIPEIIWLLTFNSNPLVIKEISNLSTSNFFSQIPDWVFVYMNLTQSYGNEILFFGLFGLLVLIFGICLIIKTLFSLPQFMLNYTTDIARTLAFSLLIVTTDIVLTVLLYNLLVAPVLLMILAIFLCTIAQMSSSIN